MSFALSRLSARHCEATALLAARTAHRLKLDEATIFRIERIAHIHDIDLTGIDPEMIAKREPLTDLEFNLLRQHPERGADMLKATPCLADWAPIVRARTTSDSTVRARSTR